MAKETYQKELLMEALNHIGEAVKCINLIVGIEKIEYNTPGVKWTTGGTKVGKKN